MDNIDILSGEYGGTTTWHQREYKAVYGEYTASFLLERMLSRIPDTFDKREGGIIYDALAPAAIELEIMYMELDWILKNIYGDTADREGLIAIARDRGLAPYPANQAIVKGEFDIQIPIGSRFNFEDLNYYTKEYIDKYNDKEYYQLVCEEMGEVGNVPYGKLVSIEPIKNLKHAFIVGVIRPGEEEETTESFRSRYYRNINTNAYGGNIDDYLDKVHAIEGVGGVKVYPIWQGGGTVKIVFTDTEHNKPTTEFTEKVQEMIDPVTNHGKGIGIAPIGHTVTVLGAEEEAVSFAFNLVYKDGHNWETVKEEVQTTLELYLKGLRKEWENHRQIVIRITRIETRLLDVEGILDINSTKINGTVRNYEVQGEKIPILGDVHGQ